MLSKKRRASLARVRRKSAERGKKKTSDFEGHGWKRKNKIGRFDARPQPKLSQPTSKTAPLPLAYLILCLRFEVGGSVSFMELF